MHWAIVWIHIHHDPFKLSLLRNNLVCSGAVLYVLFSIRLLFVIWPFIPVKVSESVRIFLCSNSQTFKMNDLMIKKRNKLNNSVYFWMKIIQQIEIHGYRTLFNQIHVPKWISIKSENAKRKKNVFEIYKHIRSGNPLLKQNKKTDEKTILKSIWNFVVNPFAFISATAKDI